MKSVIAGLYVALFGFSALAETGANYEWIFNSMDQAEVLAAKARSPRTGEYFFGNKDARMLIYSEASVLHTVQIRYQGQSKNFSIKSDTDKNELRKMIEAGADANALGTYLVQNVEIDGVIFELLAAFPGRPDSATLIWSGASYSGLIPGFPGLRKKHNRDVSIITDTASGMLTGGEIFQISLSTLLSAETLPLVLP